MSCTFNIRRGDDGDWPMCGAGSNIVAKAYYSRQKGLGVGSEKVRGGDSVLLEHHSAWCR